MHEGHRERLRERLRQCGLKSFADHEVLELLLTYPIPRKNTNGTAHLLLERFGSLEAVFHAKETDLMKVEGMGKNAALFLKLMLELSLFMSDCSRGKKRPRLSSPFAAAMFSLNLMRAERYECVYVVSLNKKHELIHAERLTSGSLTQTQVYPRLVAESALQHNAYAVLLLHNHPSGDPTPSKSDLTTTEIVKTALNAIEIGFYDHLIVGKDIVYSYGRGLYIGENQLYERMPPDSALSAQERAAPAIAAEKKL